MNVAQTKAAASEVLQTHANLKDGALSEYLDKYFAKSWAHFDVNESGMLGVEVMPQFMRLLASDQQMQLQ